MSTIKNQTNHIKFLINISVLFSGIVICGAISVLLGKDLSWDLANYHFYNPFAYLHHRSTQDYWPFPFIQAYFSPTMDFLTYFLVNYTNPIFTMFLMGALHGINFWLTYRISIEILNSLAPEKYSNLIAVLLALIGMYGPTALPGMGSFQQDNTVSIFILSFVLLQLRTWRLYASCHKISWLSCFISCIFLGIATGCKLTAGIYIGGTIIACLLMSSPRHTKIKILCLSLLGIATGLLLANGYWMLFLWQHYQNPFFPFFNSIFHSPHFPDISWRDTRFLPTGWLQTLFFPFFFSWNGQTSELPFTDFRFALLYLAAIYYMWHRIRNSYSAKLNLTTQWFLLFFVSSYILWQYYFSILRYIVSLEMLAPLAIYLFIYQSEQRSNSRKLYVTLCSTLIFFTMSPVKPIRAPWYNQSYFNVQLPQIIKSDERAVVLMPIPAFADFLDPRPQTYLIPFLPSQWRFVGIAFWQKKYLIPDALKTLQLSHSSESVYLLTPKPYLPLMQEIARSLYLNAPRQCEHIFTDRQKVTYQELLICKIR